MNKLENLITSYLEGDKESLEELMSELSESIAYSAKYVKKQIGQADYEEVVAELTLKVIESLPKYDGNRSSVSTYVNRTLNYAVPKIMRSIIKANDLARLDGKVKSDGEEEAATSLIDTLEDDTKTDELVIERIVRREEQRQLLNTLYQKADSFTRSLINEYLTDADANNNKIATKLGVDESRVRRTLVKMRKLVQSNCENYNDLFTVCTTKKYTRKAS